MFCHMLVFENWGITLRCSTVLAEEYSVSENNWWIINLLIYAPGLYSLMSGDIFNPVLITLTTLRIKKKK